MPFFGFVEIAIPTPASINLIRQLCHQPMNHVTKNKSSIANFIQAQKQD
jgi:hypothetical protein